MPAIDLDAPANAIAKPSRPDFVIRVDFPALDRFIDFRERNEQKKIDAATAAVQAVTTRLQQSNQALEAIIQKGE